MRRSESRLTQLMRLRFPQRFAVGLMAVAWSNAALGHTLLLSQGDVVIEEHSAFVELEVSAEDFVHWYGLPGDPNGGISLQSIRDIAERHALALHRILTIRDEEGKPLPSDAVRVHFDPPRENMVTYSDLRNLRATYTAKFSYPAAPHFLTFQLSMAGDCPSVFWQATFSVHVHGRERGRMIRLTSRGNAETVELRGNDGGVSIVSGETAPESSPTCGGEGAAGLITPCANIDFGMKSIEVRITMPLALLRTWIALPAGDELLGPDQQKSARTAIERLLIPALSVESEGKKYVAQVTSVAFLSIDENEIAPHAEGKAYSLLTGRLVARLHIQTTTVLEQADLQWNLFNGAVLSATAMISGNGPAVLHEFSTYQPNYHWQRGL